MPPTELDAAARDADLQIDMAAAVGERHADVEHAAEELFARVEEADYSPASKLIALEYMNAAVAVLKAGVERLTKSDA